jgi:phage shock protein PspC (stress-responsive transcriptional regulator)
LFRDPDNRVFGGVCSGIGHYFGIDPVILRIIFVVSFIFFGTGILIYLILWLVIPKAVTSADKLSMKGEPVNVENIKRKVQEESETVKKR